jgi:NAD(P)-dependent dehydrogenase (short-subunit alcohol dehydrogenase family)
MGAPDPIRGVHAVLYSNLFVTLPVPRGGSELAQQVFIVTGSNTGLGFEASRHLSRLGVGRLIMAVRTPAKGEAARKKILASTGRPEASIEVWPLDMDVYDSVKAFANRATAELPRIDGVLANAGIMTTNFSLSEGIEKTLNVNVISTFLLYALLLPAMRASGKTTGNPCRFSIPNTALHYTAALGELTDAKPGMLQRLGAAETAVMDARYPLSKVLVIYAVRELAERAQASGREPVIINTPNPSFCKSGLADEMQGSAAFRLFERAVARTTEEGSRTLVHGVLAGKETNGHYLNDCHVQV